MSKLTVVQMVGDWEILYVDGEERYSNHIGRCWPDKVLSIVEEHDIDDVEKLYIDDTDNDCFAAGALTTGTTLDDLREVA